MCVLGWLFFGLFVCWVVGDCEFCGLGYGVFVFFYWSCFEFDGGNCLVVYVAVIIGCLDFDGFVY